MKPSVGFFRFRRSGPFSFKKKEQTGRHTVISTNLSLELIAQRYSPQLTSRIGGLYRELTFYGDDLRLM